MMKFEAILNSYRGRVEEGLKVWTPPADERPEWLHRAMRYSLEAGGKRIRPVLVLAAADLRKPLVDPLPAAVAIECIHTYSLIHDDLPAIDDAELRRGRPTSHRQFDEPTAILAGDALLTYAFELLGDAYLAFPEPGLRLVRELSRAASSRHLIGGQMEDIQREGQKIAESDLEFIHLNKTSALFSASLAMGLICGGADEAALSVARELGQRLGLAFQYIDDILDATSDSKTTGKDTGRDQEVEKNTAVRLFGLEEARRRATSFTNSASDLCRQLPGDSGFLQQLIRELENRVA